MKIAITGGTGFVGGHTANALAVAGHEIVIIARLGPARLPWWQEHRSCPVSPVGLDDVTGLTRAMDGCQAVVHCAGINRERGHDTFESVHVGGTRNVVEAARRAGARKIVLVSFLRARPDCGSPYHESKWRAEEIVRRSGLDYTILKCGVIYGRGDHMLDHLSRAFHTFPVFGLVGMREKPIRPVSVRDVMRIMVASVVEGKLSRVSVPVTGPEELLLGEAVRRVASVVGRRPVYVRLPVAVHYVMGWCLERAMTIPLVSVAQVRILSEGIVEPVGVDAELPSHLKPRVAFTLNTIRDGLPEPAGFGWRDWRCCADAAIGTRNQDS
jgi:NADH dehydrogenase